MNKINQILLLIISISLFGLSANAQYVGVRGLPNGLYAATYMEFTFNGKIVKSAIPNGMSYQTGDRNVITRTYANFHKNEFYGYDLEIEKTAELEKYKITIKPMSENFQKEVRKKYSLYPNLNFTSVVKTPASKIVNDGDTIAIDILENRKDNEKITDHVKITKEWRPFGNYFPEFNRTPAKDFTLEDVQIKLSKFDVYLNGKKVTQIGGAANGGLVWLGIPNGKGKGRFIFSIIPRQGFDFQKVGTLKDYTIEFDFNGDNYQIVSSVPIISTHQTWRLWILHDPNFESTFKSDYEFGSADNVEILFKK